MLNTLGVRSALGAANRRKLSFRNVSNVVVQLLHTIKYSVPVPFSHMATGGPGSPYPSTSGGAGGPGAGGAGCSGGGGAGSSSAGGGGLFLDKNARKVMQSFAVAFFCCFCRFKRSSILAFCTAVCNRVACSAAFSNVLVPSWNRSVSSLRCTCLFDTPGHVVYLYSRPQENRHPKINLTLAGEMIKSEERFATSEWLQIPSYKIFPFSVRCTWQFSSHVCFERVFVCVCICPSLCMCPCVCLCVFSGIKFLDCVEQSLCASPVFDVVPWRLSFRFRLVQYTHTYNCNPNTPNLISAHQNAPSPYSPLSSISPTLLPDCKYCIMFIAFSFSSL